MTPNQPKYPVAQPMSMFVWPQINKPKERPIVLMIGTDMMFPVAQMNPPNMATG